MTTLQENAYAKLNLTLDVLGKRDDGYHELETVMQQITLYDEIEIDVQTGEDWKLECDWDEVPTDSSNLAWRAVGVFYRHIGKDPQGISIRITKRIPMQAGLGGGSADAAAVLRALNRHEGEPLTQAELVQLAAKIGSDVPFCVQGGTALVKGRGELVEALPDMPQCFYCIAKPDFSISTPALFAEVDQEQSLWHPDTQTMLQALERQDLLHVAGSVGNTMEPLVASKHSQIQQIKQTMLDCGALGAAMTGSGSAVFGVFDAFDMAALASMQLMESCKTYLSRNVE